VATVLTGLASATARSQPGMPVVGTKTFETIATGSARTDSCAAVSSRPMTSPRYIPTQVIANWNSTSSPSAASARPRPRWTRQPTASPQIAMNTNDTAT
jgi:hypothetical protein